MSSQTLPQNIAKDDVLRFDDHTDLELLGLETEAHDWLIRANLPRRPTGLRLDDGRSDFDILISPTSYRVGWRILLMPVLAIGLVLCSLLLIHLQLPQHSMPLLVLAIGLLLFLGLYWQHSRQLRLFISSSGVFFGTTRDQQYRSAIDWSTLAGVSVQRCFAGYSLVIMSKRGTGHSLWIDYLPASQLRQIVHLIRTQIAQRGSR
ncbi:MAG: hypothetical protein VXW65_04700 [Pseudomonadota bacterium]|nr:hypothetical protein [Pseudomonadota bacterium]